MGLVSGVGVAADTKYSAASVAKLWGTFKALDEQDIITAVEAAVADELPTQTIIGIPTGAALQESGTDVPSYLMQPWLAKMRLQGTQLGSGSTLERVESLSQTLSAAKNTHEAIEATATSLASKLSRALAVPREEISLSRSATSYGVDSLVAVEIRTWAVKEAKSDISIFDILENNSLDALAEKVARNSELVARFEGK